MINFTCVYTISLNFGIYLLDFPWKIVVRLKVLEKTVLYLK